MPRPEKTPGETAYAAYCHYCAGRGVAHLPPWTSRTIDDRRAWEAAAHAALEVGLRHARAVVRHWNEFGPEYGFDETLHALETWLQP